MKTSTALPPISSIYKLSTMQLINMHEPGRIFFELGQSFVRSEQCPKGLMPHELMPKEVLGTKSWRPNSKLYDGP